MRGSCGLCNIWTNAWIVMRATQKNKHMPYPVATLQLCRWIKFSFVYNKMVLTFKMSLVQEYLVCIYSTTSMKLNEQASRRHTIMIMQAASFKMQPKLQHMHGYRWHQLGYYFFTTVYHSPCQSYSTPDMLPVVSPNCYQLQCCCPTQSFILRGCINLYNFQTSPCAQISTTHAVSYLWSIKSPNFTYSITHHLELHLLPTELHTMTFAVMRTSHFINTCVSQLLVRAPPQIEP
jgi:hypothetical protein